MIIQEEVPFSLNSENLKTQLHKTETTVTYADGISLVESKDDDGKTVVKHTSSGSYGFVPSVVADLQVGEILPGLIMGMITYCTARQCSPLRRKFMWYSINSLALSL